MAASIACALPAAVIQHIETKIIPRYHYQLPSVYSVLLHAVRQYTGTETSSEANNAAGLIATQMQCTKTDVYRTALITFDADIADLWPEPKRSPAHVQRAHKLMAPPVAPDPTPVDPLAATRTRLVSLMADLQNLSSRQIKSRIQTILKGL